MLLRRAAAVRRAEQERKRAEMASRRAQAAAERSSEALRLAQIAKEHAKRVHERLDALERGPDQRDLDAEERDRRADQRDLEADERDRLADQRDLEADERDRLADQRDLEADERDRLADRREDPRTPRALAEKSAERLPSLSDSAMRLLAQQDKLRLQTAAVADLIAEGADGFADSLEASATRGDRERRLAMAASEREVARRARRDAARWRGDIERAKPSGA